MKATDAVLTGPPAADPAARRWQQHLNQVTGVDSGPLPPLLQELTEAAVHDPYRPVLARQLTHLATKGVDLQQLLFAAATDRPLPDDHPSAALWWRLHRHLPNNVTSPPERVAGPHPPPQPDPAQAQTALPSQPGSTDSVVVVCAS